MKHFLIISTLILFLSPTVFAGTARYTCKKGEKIAVPSGLSIIKLECQSENQKLTAYLDPSNTVWTSPSALPKDQQHSEYCSKIDARLPSVGEITLLSKYLGKYSQEDSREDYNPRVIPDLENYWYVTSSYDAQYPEYTWGFNGFSGWIVWSNVISEMVGYENMGVLCILNAKNYTE